MIGLHEMPLSSKMLMMRFWTFACCFVIAWGCVLTAFIGNVDIQTFTLSIYTFLFTKFLFWYECHLPSIGKTFAAKCGFLYNPYAKVMFELLIALLCFALSLPAQIGGGCLIAVALLSLYMHVTNEEYNKLEWQRLETDLKANTETARRAAEMEAAHDAVRRQQIEAQLRQEQDQQQSAQPVAQQESRDFNPWVEG